MTRTSLRSLVLLMLNTCRDLLLYDALGLLYTKQGPPMVPESIHLGMATRRPQRKAVVDLHP